MSLLMVPSTLPTYNQRLCIIIVMRDNSPFALWPVLLARLRH